MLRLARFGQEHPNGPTSLLCRIDDRRSGRFFRETSIEIGTCLKRKASPAASQRPVPPGLNQRLDREEVRRFGDRKWAVQIDVATAP
jgi:hypothetical protein